MWDQYGSMLADTFAKLDDVYASTQDPTQLG